MKEEEYVSYWITSEYKIEKSKHEKLEAASRREGVTFREFMMGLQLKFLKLGMQAAADELGVDPDDLLEEICRQTMQKSEGLS